MGTDDFVCPNCSNSEKEVGQAHPRKVQPKGKQFNPHSTNPQSNPMQFMQGVPINKYQSVKESEVKNKKHKKNPDIVPFESGDFLQCVDPSELTKRNKRRNVDEKIEEVTKSCLDLAIDG